MRDEMRLHAAASYAFAQLTGRKPGNIACRRPTTGSRSPTPAQPRPSTSRLVIGRRIAEDASLDSTARVLRHADGRGRPRAIAQKGEVKVTFGRFAVGRDFMPRVDELRALAQRIVPERFEVEGPFRHRRAHAGQHGTAHEQKKAGRLEA